MGCGASSARAPSRALSDLTNLVSWVDHLVGVWQQNLDALKESSRPRAAHDPRSTRILVEQLDCKVQTPMKVIPVVDFNAFERLPRSSDQLTIEARPGMFIIFVSHRWWNSTLDPKTAHPDDSKCSKYAIVRDAVARVCATHGIDADDAYLWLDYACIDQDDPRMKARGIASLIGCAAARGHCCCGPVAAAPARSCGAAVSCCCRCGTPRVCVLVIRGLLSIRYISRCRVMVIPMRPSEQTGIRYTCDLPDYGERAWCRQPASQPVSQPVSQSASQPVSQSVSQSVLHNPYHGASAL